MNRQYIVLRKAYFDADAKRKEMLENGIDLAKRVVSPSHWYAYMEDTTILTAVQAAKDASTNYPKEEVVCILEIDIDTGDILKSWNKYNVEDFVEDFINL